MTITEAEQSLAVEEGGPSETPEAEEDNELLYEDTKMVDQNQQDLFLYEDMKMEEEGISERTARRRRLNVVTETAAAPFDISYRPGRVLLYSPPRQRQRWGDTQVLPRVDWGDLFFDLFYVAATYNVSNIIVQSPNKEGLLYAAGTFLPVMGIWTQKSLAYDSRYVTESDIYHRLLNVILLLVLGIAVLHIRPAHEMANAAQNPSMFGFALMLVVERLLGILLYAEVYFVGVGQRHALKQASLRDIRTQCWCLPFYIAATVVSAVEFFGSDNGSSANRLLAEEKEESAYDGSSSYYPERTTNNVPIYLCLFGQICMMLMLGLNIIFCFPKGGKHKEISVPMNIDFVIHRNGEWTMLMLGESIFSLLVVEAANEGKTYYTVFYCGVCTVIFLQLLHFKSQPHHADSHASRRSKNAGVIWNAINHAYSLALVLLGASFTYFLLLADEKESGGGAGDDRLLLTMEIEEEKRWLAGGATKIYTDADLQTAAHLFGGSLAIVFFCLDGMTVMHLGFEESHCRCVSEKKKKNYKGIGVIVVHAAMIAFAATLSQWQTDPSNLCIIGLCCVFLQIILRRFGRLYLSEEKCGTTRQQRKKFDHVPGKPLSDSETGEATWPNVTHARAEPINAPGD